MGGDPIRSLSALPAQQGRRAFCNNPYVKALTDLSELLSYDGSMKLLYGKDVAAFIKQRHMAQAAGLPTKPRLAIVRMGDDAATDRYLRSKQRYGEDIGADVDIYSETPDTIIDSIKKLGKDPKVTGIIVQLPLSDRTKTDAALATVPPNKDVDGLAPNSDFEAGTPKAVLWLLASHNVDVKGRIVVVGQGRLVGEPLADRLEASGLDVVRCDIHTKDLAAETRQADIIFTGTGQPNLIKSDMVKEGAVVVDTGSPLCELDPSLFEREDLTLTPNPGGVGPMTVSALFDNLLIAANRQSKV
jgi:methylenetetrahydrofolate dehydrogenase (NADP+)/methenyltetrahydrofolate cyclohydrolase